MAAPSPARARRRRLAGLGSAAVLIALVALLLASGDDRHVYRGLRADPVTEPFEGRGTWIDLYDQAAWADPAAAVADMAAHGVRTIYLQTSNADRDVAIVFPDGVSRFIEAAHASGLRVVGWYLPSFRDLDTDLERAEAAVEFRSPGGEAFDAFALDIESMAVENVRVRTRRLIELSDDLRETSGDRYALGAIVPPPPALEENGNWDGFPYRALAARYDAILPMTYFTFRANRPAEVGRYVRETLGGIRRDVGSPRVPIHPIGGIAGDATAGEVEAYARTSTDRGALGVSLYTWAGVTEAQWAALTAG